MNIHEYQAKEVLKKYGVPVPDYYIVSDYEEAKSLVEELNLTQAVIKVQVHAGGRGKAGGVKMAKSKEEILQYTKDLIGLKIVNNQTGKEGVVAHEVMISDPVDIEKEYYVGAIIDRKQGEAMLITSPEGGMEIEEIAEKSPEKILKTKIPLNGELKRFQLFNIAKFMGWEGACAKEGMAILKALAKAFMETDSSLLEINPLVMTTEKKVVALDAKMGIDDNALFRQQDIAKFYDPTQVSDSEVKAQEHDLAYIALDGEIGCMVNGAGLAMATMDIIQSCGGKPANFLDVGGSATKEKVAEGFKIILSDPQVKAILVNIFGGIMNCATIAEGVIHAVNELGIEVPLVVRMEGTNVDKGREILDQSNLNIITAEGMQEAAEKVVAAR